MSKAKLKAMIEVYLPRRVAALLAEAAERESCGVDTLATSVLMKWAAMEEAAGPVEDWRAVPIDHETAETVAEFTHDMGDSETLNLASALTIFFINAAETKQSTGGF